MNESAMELTPKFEDRTINDRPYRDRFVFPEVLVGTFVDNDAIIEAMEEEIKNRIQEKTIKNFSNEVILKNVMGPFYNDLSEEERGIFLSIIGEMKEERINILDDKNFSIPPVHKKTSSEDWSEAVKGARDFLNKEAERAGHVVEVTRNDKGQIELVGDPVASEGKILEINDADEE